MNARFSLLRARTAPGVLAAAIGLAFGLSAPAQAQYRYPGTASSSGHVARAARVRARAPERSPYTASGRAKPPARAGEPKHSGAVAESGPQYYKPSGSNYSYGSRAAQAARPAPARKPRQVTAAVNSGHRSGNPSMRPGEACPPGSNCAPHGRNQQTSGPARSGAYGAHESYGYATSPTSAREAATPASRNASVSPVRAGARGALNYGPSQTSNTNFRNSVTNKTSGPSAPNMNSGQPTSVPGPNGPVNVGGPQGYTGMDGKKHTLGQGTPDLAGAGYGHPSHQQSPMGNIGKPSGGGAPQTSNGMDPYRVDNGAAGATKGKTGAGDFNKTHVYNPDTHQWEPKPKGDSGDKSLLQKFHDWHPVDDFEKSLGGDDSGSKKPKKGGKDGGSMPVDDVDTGPGEIVSGTGQVVQPGKKKGQDTGGGQTGDAGTTNSGGQNAQGRYVAPSGQDAPVKPKEKGALKMDFNGKAGAIDPKQSGVNGGGG